MRCIINKTKAVLSCIITGFFGIFGIFYITHGMWIEAVVFLAFSLIFGLVFRENASVLTIDRQNVTLSFMRKQRRQMSWDDIKELGLINENITSRGKAGKGHRYIYLSPYEMTDSQRFTMVIHWPPKDILYIEYGEKQLEFIMTLYGNELRTCNIEEDVS